MQLLTIQDPRDNLEKARRSELVKFAQAHRVAGIDPAMPAILIRRILRSKGLIDIDVPVRPLGKVPGARGSTGPSTPENTVEMLADDDLMQQWQRQQAPEATMPTVPTVPHVSDQVRQSFQQVHENMDQLDPWDGMTEMSWLRRECKAAGIKMKRTDKKPDLRAKLNGENTSQCSQ